MKIVLIQNIKKLGGIGDIIEVQDGYAINFLIKNKLAVELNSKQGKDLIQTLEERKNTREDKKNTNEVLIDQLPTKLKIKANINEDNKLYGKVGKEIIFKELTKLNFKLDKNWIEDVEFESPGEYFITVAFNSTKNTFKKKIKIIVEH